MHAFLGLIICTTLLISGTVEAGERRRHHGHPEFGHGQHLIVPPGAKVIIIPAPRKTFDHHSSRRFDRHGSTWLRRDFRHAAPMGQFQGRDRSITPGFRRFTTPGFSSGWTTVPPLVPDRRRWSGQ